jgi:hypothetical protein
MRRAVLTGLRIHTARARAEGHFVSDLTFRGPEGAAPPDPSRLRIN